LILTLAKLFVVRTALIAMLYRITPTVRFWN
jgi:hypothetical protein